MREEEEALTLEDKDGQRETMKRTREGGKMEVLEDKENNAKNEVNERENTDPPMLSAVASTSVEEVVEIGERMEQELQQFRQQGAIPRRGWSFSSERHLQGSQPRPQRYYGYSQCHRGKEARG